MKSRRFVLCLLPLALISLGVSAQVYRWVDSEGKVHYTDRPPPPDAKNIRQRKITLPAAAEYDGLPYEVRQAAKNFPVVLYTADCGEACTRAKKLLVQRGIPFSEKNPQKPDDAEAFKKLIGGNIEVPVVQIGNRVLRGLNESEWHGELDAAGYPRIAPSRVVAARPEKQAATPAQPAAKTDPDAAQKHPVTLFNLNCGAPCDRARDMLKKRDIPFTEKIGLDPVEVKAMKEITGTEVVVLPALVVGSKALPGFDEIQWNKVLDSAGYPKAPPSATATPGPSQAVPK